MPGIKKVKLLYILGIIVLLTLFLSSCQYYFDTYNISGKVVDDNGQGIAGVIIRFDGPYSPTITNDEGWWSKDNVRGVILVTPEKNGWQFTPEFREVETENRYVNFTGIPTSQTYTVSGKVEDKEGKGIEGVVIRFSNGYSSVTTDEFGKWEKEGLAGEIEVTPEKNDYTFEPPSRIVSGPDSNINFTGILTSQTYTVSGRVEDKEGKGIEGVVIRFSNGYSSVTTDEFGKWEKEGLAGEIEVTPEKNDYTFEPPSRKVSGPDSNINFTAYESNYKVSGWIKTSSGEGIPRVEVQFSNGSDSVFSGVNGYWEKSGLNGEVIITPVLEGWVFNPPNKPVESSEDDVNFTGEPSPEYAFYGASGRVIDENGDGIPGVEIQFKRDGVVFWMTFTDNDGNWQVDEYLWGTVRIEPQGGNYRPPFLEIEGERTDIIFRKE